MSSTTKLLGAYLRSIAGEASPSRRLRVFDFDDTLVRTGAKVHVVDDTGREFDLTPGEFAVYEKQPGDQFDYTDFQKLIDPRPIKWMNRVLRAVYERHGSGGLVVLSARSYSGPIAEYLSTLLMQDVEVVALNNSDPSAKAAWVESRITRDGLEFVEFYDDSSKNTKAVGEIRRRLPGVSIVSRHIVHNRVDSLLSLF